MSDVPFTDLRASMQFGRDFAIAWFHSQICAFWSRLN